MCEGHEKKAHYEGLSHLLEEHLGTTDFHIRGLWADATDDESMANWPASHPVTKGLVYKLGPGDPCEVIRSRQNIRPTFTADLEELEWKNLHYTSQGLLLDFGGAWLEVCVSCIIYYFFLPIAQLKSKGEIFASYLASAFPKSHMG
jgi:hypothetical protein